MSIFHGSLRLQKFLKYNLLYITSPVHSSTRQYRQVHNWEGLELRPLYTLFCVATPTATPIVTPILYNVKVLILLCYLSVADSLQKWLTHSRARHRLMTSPRSFSRPRSILKCVLSLSVRVLLFMLLVVAGDVERNPGPQGKEGTTCIVWCI